MQWKKENQSKVVNILTHQLVCFYSLFKHEMELSCAKNEKFGYGVAAFQGITNIAINSRYTAIYTLVVIPY